MIVFYLIQDGLLAAVAAVGFASVSHPPRSVYICCASAAAIGHACRYLLMNNPVYAFHIIPASGLAAFLIGTLSVFIAPRIKCPAEACFSPALLPMIPGMYAYRSFKALLLCLSQQEDMYGHYLYLLVNNGLNAAFIVLTLVIGATLPVFLFKKISFQATR